VTMAGDPRRHRIGLGAGGCSTSSRRHLEFMKQIPGAGEHAPR
jgi:hypothetical protein